MTVRYHYMGPRKAAEQPRIVPRACPSGHMCPVGRGSGADGGGSTIRASLWPGSGPPNRADRLDAKLALYSVPRAPCAPRPMSAFPKEWPYRLRGRSETSKSTVRASFGYPRTQLDRCVLVGPRTGPYTSRGRRGWPRGPLAQDFLSSATHRRRRPSELWRIRLLPLRQHLHGRFANEQLFGTDRGKTRDSTAPSRRLTARGGGWLCRPLLMQRAFVATGG